MARIRELRLQECGLGILLLAGQLLVFCLPGSSVAGAPVSDDLEASLGLPTDPEFAAVILAAEDRRQLSESLLRLSFNGAEEVRSRAALAMGRIGLSAGLPRLVELLADPSWRVRALAAFAVGKIEFDLSPDDADAARARAAEALTERLADAAATVAVQAAWGLGQVGGELAAASVKKLLGVRSPSSEPNPAAVVAAALDAWWRLPPADPLVVAPHTSSPEASIRLAAAHALRRTDDPNALPILLPLLGDSEPEVRAMAARGLRTAAARTALAQALPLLTDRDWRVAVEVLEWLFTVWSLPDTDQPGSELVGDVMRISLDRNLHLRRASLRTLGALAEDWPVARQRLVEALEEDREPAVRVTAVEALLAAGKDGVEAALKALRQRQESVQVGPMSLEMMPTALEGAAMVRLLARSTESADRLWLDELLRRGPMAARAAGLRVIAELEPDLGARRALELMRAGPAPLQAVAAEVIQEIGIRDSLPIDDGVDWGRELWNLQLSLREEELIEPRLLALEAFRALHPALLQQRSQVLLGDGDRVVRLWMYRTLLARSTSDVDATRDTAGTADGRVATAPQSTGLTDADYRAAAERLIARQAERPLLELETSRGIVLLELRPDWAPLTVEALLQRVEAGFFDGLLFHRVISNFVVQTGDPTATGYGGAPLLLRNEDSPIPYAAGTVGLALAGKDTGGSQWFVTHGPQPHLTGLYPAFGRVVDGQRALDRIQPGDRLTLRRRR